MTTPSLRAGQSSGGLNGATGTTTFQPAATVSGDLTLAFFTWQANPGTVTPPSGWTVVTGPTSCGTDFISATTTYAAVYKRTATASGSTSTGTWNWANTVQHGSVVVALSGAAAVDAAGTFSSTKTASSITCLDNDPLLLYLNHGQNTSATPPSGMTEHVDVVAYDDTEVGGTNLRWFYIAYLATTAGATGTKAHTGAGTDDDGAVLISVSDGVSPSSAQMIV